MAVLKQHSNRQEMLTQLPIRLLYDYLERHQFPRERMNMTDITIKFRGNV